MNSNFNSKLRKLTLLLIVSVSSSLCSIVFAQHSITGTSQVCDGDCEQYEIANGGGGPYFWISTGNIQESNSGSQVEICWDVIGENNIQLVDFSANFASQSVTTSIQVGEYPNPEILFPAFPDCIVRDSLGPDGTGNEFETIECKTVCSGSIATYSSLISQGSTIAWTVTGGAVISENQEEITIQWNNIGSASIAIEETSNGCSSSTEHCIEILEPLDVAITALNGSPSMIDVCLDQQVYLQGVGSTNVTQYEWIFDNGSYASGSSTSVSYDQPGAYEVTLIGSTECGCTEMTTYTINVDVSPGPEILCAGTVCSGTEATYYAADACGGYNWNTSSNGTITDGGTYSDSYMTVMWSGGPSGTITLSTDGCTAATCPIPTTVEIPIISGSTSVSGPIIVCKDGYSNYKMQYYNGVDYSWNISGNGNIIAGHRTNEITVEWDKSPQASNQSTITVEYDNCYLECGGQASLVVDLLPRFELNNDPVRCVGNNIYLSAYEGWNQATVDFEITAPDGTIYAYPSTTQVSDVYNLTGKYIVKVIDAQGLYCNDEIISSFELIDAPITPTQIDGPLSICLNEYYTYSVPTSQTNISVRWYVVDGSQNTFYNTDDITLQWTSTGPYRITVSYYYDDVFCSSDQLSVDLETLQNTNITGSNTSCVDETAIYSVGQSTTDNNSWSITPPQSGSISNNGDGTISITWHEAGNHQIQSTTCGTTLSLVIDVAPLPTDNAIFPDKVCPGELANIMIPGTFQSVAIEDINGELISNTASTDVKPGEYLAIVTNLQGCERTIPIVIDSFPAPRVRVSSPDENAFCLPNPDVTITALNTDDGYNYEWFFNGIAMGITAPAISTNAYGDYHVEITDQNGCTAISNTHTLHEWCTGDQPPGTCSGGGNAGVLTLGGFNITCDDLQFNVKGTTYNSTSFSWDFGDPDSGPANFTTGPSVTHEFSSAGYYYVFVYGNIIGERAVDIFTVPAKASFDYDLACVEAPVEFINTSTFIPGITINAYTWDFGDPTSGPANTSTDKHPNHQYSAPGNYTVSLEIESSQGCISSYQMEINVLEGPFVEFVLPYSTCLSEGLKFQALESDDIISYSWDFDDLTSGSANTSQAPTAIHTFSTSGIYNVTLSAENIYGCISTITKPVDVTTTSVSGDIVSNTAFPMCYGELATLTAPAGGDYYLWSTGESTASIEAQNPGLYSVSIFDPSGCVYAPAPINVSVQKIIDRKIRGIVFADENDFQGQAYFDSLTICQGDKIAFSTSFLAGATYAWSIGSITNSYNNSTLLNNLLPGIHDLSVSISDPATGCDVISEPFKIIVNALPANITIDAPSGTLCEGQPYQLSINSPTSDMKYYWNNGSVTSSITVSSPGEYFVMGVNKNGCERRSSSVYISPIPDANRINLGCTMSCFPDTICVPNIPNAVSYQWLLDGLAISNPLFKDLVVNTGGEYQLVIENYYGCQDTSDIFNIDPEPSSQTISGIVYLDVNQNGIYDSGDELLVNIPIEMYAGSVLLESKNTDASGAYIFDQITDVNPTLKIDTAGLGLEVTGGLFEIQLSLTSCDEQKEQDFAFIQNCAPTSASLDMFTCTDQPIIINNISLSVGDTYQFEDINEGGCDSTTNITVMGYPAIQANITTEPSCSGQEAGALAIDIVSGVGLQFAIDDPLDMNIELSYGDLSVGSHILYIEDSFGCTQEYPFLITENSAPETLISTTSTCANMSAGEIQIDIISGNNLQFAVDNPSQMSTSLSFSNLSAGSHTLYIVDGDGCTHENQFTIDIVSAPQMVSVTTPSCYGGNYGAASITPSSTGMFQYAIDGGTFSNNGNFENLTIGSHIIYVMDMSTLCLHEYPVEISENPIPEIALNPTSPCGDQEDASITVTAITTGNYEYSIDGIIYGPNNTFDGLSAGEYTVYVSEGGNCTHQYTTTISSQPEPTLSITTNLACLGMSDGSIQISNEDQTLQYSLDGITFSTDSTFTNLDEGTYTLYILKPDGCTFQRPVVIEAAPDLEVVFVQPEIDCSVSQLVLAPEVITSASEPIFLWGDGSTDNQLLVNTDGPWTVEVSDKCAIQDYSFDVSFEEINNDIPVYFPNVFSPDQNGVNDCFVPTMNSDAEIISYEMMIFDRWGNKCFESTDPQECWDGTLNNKITRPGVFVYYLELSYTYCEEVETIEKYGDVTVLLTR